MSSRGERDAVTATLLGRDAELDRLSSWLSASVTDGAALCIVGAAGTGKTTLLDAAAVRATSAGVHVLRAAGSRCREQVSFSALEHLLAPVRERIEQQPALNTAARALPLGRRDGAAPTDLQAYAATLMLFRRLARDQPVAVLVDDAQWLDAASAVVLSFLARRVAGSSIGVLLTTRSGYAGAIEGSTIPRLELAPLDEDMATRLLATRFPDLSARVLERLVTAAAGIPLALVELPSLLTRAQRIGQAELPPMLSAGPRLIEMFTDRIGVLSEQGREALLLAAVNNGEPGVHERRLTGRPEFGALDPNGWLHEAEAAGLVVADRRHAQVSFCHPLVPSAVVAMSTDLERRRAHRIVATAAAPGSLHQVWHSAQASVAPDEALAADLERVAQSSLRRGDGRMALVALSRAAELSSSSSERTRRLATAAYLGADVTGDLRRACGLIADAHTDAETDLDAGTDASSVAEHDLGGLPGARRTPLSVAIAQAYLLLNCDGDIAAAHRLLVEAITSAGSMSDTIDGAGVEPDLGEALHTLMLVCFFGGSAELWLPFHAALDEVGPRAPRVLALCAATFCDPVRRAAPALPRLDAHLADLHLELDPTTVVRSAMASFYVDRTAGCREALTRVVADGRAGGAVASAIAAGIELGFDAYATGDWTAAALLLDEGADICDRHGYRLLAWPARFGQALLAAAQGDYATVDTIATAMIAFAQPRSAHQVRYYAHHARALAALGRGDPATALEQVAQISAPGQLAPSTAHALWVMLDTVESAVAVGRHDDARAHVAAMRAAAIADLSPRYAMVMATAAALVAGPTEATSLFEAALAVPGADRWSFDWARTNLLFGEHLRRQRNAPQARRRLRAAADVFSRLGAEPWRSRAATQLRGAGETLPPPRNNGRAIVLTPQQLRIATLAAGGLTNKQIAARCRTSHRGVGSVLYRVFRVLDISSRAALGDALANYDIRTA